MGNAFEPVMGGGDESTFTDRLAQPGLEGYHPYMGYEAETPQCADALSLYFKCSALNQGSNARQTITDVRERFLNFRAKHEGIYRNRNVDGHTDGLGGDTGLSQSLNYASRLLNRNRGR